MTQSTQALAQTHAHPNVKAYIYVFSALMGLTVATVTVSYFDFSPVMTIIVGLTIATVKASLVAAFFMHLKGERVLIYGILGLAAVFCLALFAIPISDSRGNSARMVHTPVVTPESQVPAEAPAAAPQKP